MYNETELRALSEIDADIVAAAKDVKVLSRLSWPAPIMHEFLAGWERGQPRLPVVRYDSGDLDDTRARLALGVERLAPMEGPLAEFLRATASSYVTLCQLLRAAGSARFSAFSQLLYGAPGDLVSGGQVNNLDAARHLLEVGGQYCAAARLEDSDHCIPAETVQAQMSARLDEVFEPGLVRVVIDPDMASKAAAGATRVRLRAEARFSEYDSEQLLQHEAFVHSLTALNGRAQPRFKAFSLGAPRTTGTQEGLATFAELLTGAIDMARVQRLALRVVAINDALCGADFIEVFRRQLAAGQEPDESFHSTMRVFRGAPVTGGGAFSKDVVYLHGLMEVHTFFRWAMQHQRLELTRHLFAGRMTIGDAVRLAPLFESGVLASPRYLPPWMVRTNGLAGYLAFSVFANRITVQALGEHHEFDRVEHLGM